MEALLNIIRTIFVCFVLACGSLMISKDVNEIALQPLEEMIGKVNLIAQNPQAVRDIQLIKISGDSDEQLETQLIQNSIVKIGLLLVLGFGEAGSEIIAKNMAKGNTLTPA